MKKQIKSPHPEGKWTEMEGERQEEMGWTWMEGERYRWNHGGIMKKGRSKFPGGTFL